MVSFCDMLRAGDAPAAIRSPRITSGREPAIHRKGMQFLETVTDSIRDVRHVQEITDLLAPSVSEKL